MLIIMLTPDRHHNTTQGSGHEHADDNANGGIKCETDLSDITTFELLLLLLLLRMLLQILDMNKKIRSKSITNLRNNFSVINNEQYSEE